MLPDEVVIDGLRFRRVDRVATRVSAHVMYDCHLFRALKGASVEALVKDWQQECAKPNEGYGRPMLCPVIVLDGEKELRRVGEMVFPATMYRDKTEVAAKLKKWVKAVSDDLDIERLLQQRPSQTTGSS